MKKLKVSWGGERLIDLAWDIVHIAADQKVSTDAVVRSFVPALKDAIATAEAVIADPAPYRDRRTGEQKRGASEGRRQVVHGR